MLRNFINSKIALRAFSYLIVAATAFIYGLWIYRESPLSLFKNMIPLGGDGISVAFYLNLVISNSWADVLSQNINSNQFGWPGSLNYTNFPSGNLLEIIIIKIFAFLTGIENAATLIHIFAIIKIVPICLIAYFFFRSLDVGLGASFFGALAFSASTFNLIRSEGHFFLGFTWAVPLSIYLLFNAYKLAFDELRFKDENFKQKKSKLKLALPAVLIGLSGFYYAIIYLILVVLFVFLHFIAKYLQFRYVNKGKSPFKIIFYSLDGYFVILIGGLIGLILQILPILLRNAKVPALAGIGDRSWTEAIIYSGNVESFFYDFVSLLLRISDHHEILNFYSQRISWEGSQVSALAGISAVAIIGWFFSKYTFEKAFSHNSVEFPKIRVLSDYRKLTFFISLSSVCALLYMPTPLNFIISKILPQLRAWGRVSVFLTFSLIAIFIVIFSILSKKSLLSWIMLTLLILIPFLEAKEFRSSRPSAVNVNQAALDSVQNPNMTLSSLKAIYKRGCAIVQVPFYPFPEFDIPNDGALDYSGLAIPFQDKGYFKWSYPAVKNTIAWKAYQPLISENPNFARVDVEYAIKYSIALGSCGVLVDRAQLTEPELAQMDNLANISTCFNKLSGDLYRESQRYITVSSNSSCYNLKNIPKEILNFAAQNKNGSLLWKIDQAYGVRFIEEFQIFPIDSVINTRVVRVNKNSPRSNYSWAFNFYDKEMVQIYPDKIKICTLNRDSQNTDCTILERLSTGELRLDVTIIDAVNDLSKIEFQVLNEGLENPEIKYWGVILSNR